MLKDIKIAAANKCTLGMTDGTCLCLCNYDCKFICILIEKIGREHRTMQQYKMKLFLITIH